MNTMEILMDILMDAGRTEKEANALLAEFLEEEAEGFAICRRSVANSNFEKALRKMADHGIGDTDEEQLLSEAIDEQYHLDMIRDGLRDAYSKAKGMFS